MTTLMNTLIDPTLKRLVAHGIPHNDSSRAMLWAIGLQESGLAARFQKAQDGSRGPARGFWQFELGGGVAGVMSHPASSAIAKKFTAEYVGSNSTNNGAVWATLAYEDVLACVFARLLLWTDPQALPPATYAGQDAAWSYYIRNWRPGKPHPDKWSANWAGALTAIKG